MNRRNFIRATALAGGGLLLTIRSSGENTLAQSNDKAGETGVLGDLLTITPDGEVHYQFIKNEMGQGVATSMAMILAEELCADWERIKIEFPDANLEKFQNAKNGGHDTGGSCTLIYQWDPLRKAGAAAREMLIRAAAKEWGTATENCYAENHFVINRLSNQKMGFGELASAAAFITLTSEPKLKDSRDYRLIGTAKPSKLIPETVIGQRKYSMDVKVPGMLYAVVARCPVFRGKLKSFDATRAIAVKGVKKVVTTTSIAGKKEEITGLPYDIRDGVAVIADSFWAAKKGREALRIVWDEGENARFSSEDFAKLAETRAMDRKDPAGYIGEENATADMDHVARTLRASYAYPHQLHSCMEPLNCTAHFKGDSCEIWMGSQAPNLIIREIKRVFNLPVDKILVHLFCSGGGFGRRYLPDVALEAAWISKAAGNVPVKLIWTREDDQLTNFAHLYQHFAYQIALDKNNKIYAWYEKEIKTYTWGQRYANPQLPAIPYNIPNLRYDFYDMEDEDIVQSCPWRGVDVYGKAFSECVMDEIANELKADPYQFRLSLLTEGRKMEIAPGGDVIESTRLINVLKLAVEKAGWGKPMEEGRGMGLAVGIYSKSYCAMVAEVTVRDNKLTVNKIVCAVDCGKVINISGAKNQIEGGIVWALTALLHGGLDIKNGRATRSNFHQNKLLRMNECPVIEAWLAENSEEKPWGLGEISCPYVAPAVLNAIHAATGKRIRKIPIVLS